MAGLSCTLNTYSRARTRMFDRKPTLPPRHLTDPRHLTTDTPDPSYTSAPSRLDLWVGDVSDGWHG